MRRFEEFSVPDGPTDPEKYREIENKLRDIQTQLDTVVDEAMTAGIVVSIGRRGEFRAFGKAIIAQYSDEELHAYFARKDGERRAFPEPIRDELLWIDSYGCADHGYQDPYYAYDPGYWKPHRKYGIIGAYSPL